MGAIGHRRRLTIRRSPSIIDSHVTALVRFLFGTGRIGAHAVTLSVGALLNFITAMLRASGIYIWMTRRRTLESPRMGGARSSSFRVQGLEAR